jgi:hypothetical protein
MRRDLESLLLQRKLIVPGFHVFEQGLVGISGMNKLHRDLGVALPKQSYAGRGGDKFAAIHWSQGISCDDPQGPGIG